jgi:hypothetical protein
MQIPVLIEPVAGGGYAARAGSPFNWSAEGATHDEALAKLRAEAARHLSNGTRAAALDVPDPTARPDPLAALRVKGVVIEPPPGDHPLLKWAGTWDLNDPLIQEWQKAVEDYRRQIDNDPDAY